MFCGEQLDVGNHKWKLVWKQIMNDNGCVGNM